MSDAASVFGRMSYISFRPGSCRLGGLAMTDIATKPVCGLVMPISAIDNLPEMHWNEVRTIISDSIEKAGFAPNLVSNADDVGIIQKRIIQNLYDNPIVVVDVSAKNPNVMFELGMRLAFDKPTIIVKDDKTTYSFDTAPIEHLPYPRDLRFTQIMEFKEKLTEKIKATHAKATSDPSYTTFLKNFGEFTVAKLDKKEVPGQEFILEEIKALRLSIDKLSVQSAPRVVLTSAPGTGKSAFISEFFKRNSNANLVVFDSNDLNTSWKDFWKSDVQGGDTGATGGTPTKT